MSINYWCVTSMLIIRQYIIEWYAVWDMPPPP